MVFFPQRSVFKTVTTTILKNKRLKIFRNKGLKYKIKFMPEAMIFLLTTQKKTLEAPQVLASITYHLVVTAPIDGNFGYVLGIVKNN